MMSLNYTKSLLENAVKVFCGSGLSGYCGLESFQVNATALSLICQWPSS